MFHVPKTEERIYHCHKCGGRLEFEVKMQRTDVCVHCAADLHCCKNCEYWDPGSYNECREQISEYVPERERTNHCTFFTFRSTPRDKTNMADARAKLDALFRKR